jgi:hypothetical protein
LGTQIKRNNTDTVAYIQGYFVVRVTIVCHGNATILSIVVVGLYVAVSDMTVLSFAI